MTASTLETGVALLESGAAPEAQNNPQWAFYQDVLVIRPLREHYDVHGKLLERVHAYIKRGAKIAIAYPDIQRRAFFFGPTLRLFVQNESDLQQLIESLDTDPLDVPAGGILLRKMRKVPETDEHVQFFRFRRKPGMERIKNHSLPITSQSTGQVFRMEINWRERDDLDNAVSDWERKGGDSYGLGYWTPVF